MMTWFSMGLNFDRSFEHVTSPWMYPKRRHSYGRWWKRSNSQINEPSIFTFNQKKVATCLTPHAGNSSFLTKFCNFSRLVTHKATRAASLYASCPIGRDKKNRLGKVGYLDFWRALPFSHGGSTTIRLNPQLESTGIKLWIWRKWDFHIVKPEKWEEKKWGKTSSIQVFKRNVKLILMRVKKLITRKCEKQRGKTILLCSLFVDGFGHDLITS